MTMRHAHSIPLIPDNIETLEPIDAQALRSMTVDDLRDWERLGGECSACRRHGFLSKYEIKKDFGTQKLIVLQALLQCVVCGNKGDNRFIVSRMARD